MVTPPGSPTRLRSAHDVPALRRRPTSTDSPGSARVSGHLASELSELKPSGNLEVNAPLEPISTLLARARPPMQSAKFWLPLESEPAALDTRAAPPGAPEFDRCVDMLRDFAHASGASAEVFHQLDSLQLQTSGALKGSIRQIQDKDLYGATLGQLEGITTLVTDPAMPFNTRHLMLADLCTDLDKCAGGVCNNIERVAVRAELLSHGVRGAAAAFKLTMLTQVLTELIHQERIEIAYETHWGKAVTQSIADACGLPVLEDDVTVRYDIPRAISQQARKELMKRCDAGSFIDHLTSKIHEEASEAFSEEMRTSFAGMAGMPLDDAFEFCKQVAESVATVDGIRLEPERLATELLQYHQGDEYCTMRRDPTLLRSRVQDELQQAGLIDMEPVTLAPVDGGGRLQFDGTRFHVDAEAGRRALSPLELARQRPADFGAHARTLALGVISGSEGAGLENFPDRWVLDAEVACALLKQLSAGSAVARMRSPAFKELQQSATSAQRNEIAIVALQGGMPVRELVSNGWIDTRADVSDLLASLVEHGLGHAVTALINDHHVRRPMHKLRIDDWTRNPASRAIYAGDEDLYRLLRKAGWAPGGVPGMLHTDMTLVSALVSGGCTAGLQILIDEGRLDDSRVALSVIGNAAAAGDPAMVAALLPRVPAKELRPALQKAISHGRVGATIVLLQHLHKTPRLRTELDAFLNNPSMTFVDLDPLRGLRQVDKYPLQVAIEMGDVEMARCLLQAGCNVAQTAEFDAMADARLAGPDMVEVLEQFQAVERERAALASHRRAAADTRGQPSRH